MLLPVKTGWRLWSGVMSLCILAGGVAAAPGESVDDGAAATSSVTDSTSAEDERAERTKSELDRWVPSLALISGLNAQRVQGTVITTDVVGTPTFPLPPNPNATPQPIVPGTPLTARTRMMTPYVGASLELMTPSWTPLPSDPRLYVHADVSYAFGPVYNIPKIGDPGVFVPPSNLGNFTTTTIRGQGAYLTAEVNPLLVAAGIGFAFTFEAGDRTLRVKPSFEYMREEVQLTGLVRRAVGPAPNGGASNIAAFRPITFQIDETHVYNGLGAGLELEMDTAKVGPVMLTLFANAKAWNFLDNELLTFEDADPYGEAAWFQFLKNEWAFNGALGLRFRWVPE